MKGALRTVRAASGARAWSAAAAARRRVAHERTLAERGERTHAELRRALERLAESAFAARTVGGITPQEDLALEPERPRFDPALATLVGLGERARREALCFVGVPGVEQDLAEPHEEQAPRARQAGLLELDE